MTVGAGLELPQARVEDERRSIRQKVFGSISKAVGRPREVTQENIWEGVWRLGVQVGQSHGDIVDERLRQSKCPHSVR